MNIEAIFKKFDPSELQWAIPFRRDYTTKVTLKNFLQIKLNLAHDESDILSYWRKKISIPEKYWAELCILDSILKRNIYSIKLSSI